MPTTNSTNGRFLRCGAVFLALTAAGLADEAGWEERLARACSERLRQIDRELAELTPQLESLPKVPIDDQGGSGGFASLQSSAVPAENSRCAVEVRWQEPATVEMVALVPARRYDAAGLDAQYGLPDDFTVDLIDAKGEVVAIVARERGTRADPIRHGHPFVYPVSPPVAAAGLRITATRLHPDPENIGSFVHAWAEAFAFEGERNVALTAEVRNLGGSAPPSPWRWQTAFLVDGQTPLGFPELPAEEHGNIGWISEGRAKASEAATMTVDLGKVMEVDAVRLLPAKRPTSDLPSGFGFPRKLALSISATGEPGDPSKWSPLTACDMRNPGHNPVLIPFPAASGRFIRIAATELWKAFDSYPAFFALSEVEVLSGGENRARGRPVYSPDGMTNVIASSGRVWSSASLCDGFGPDGRLVSTRAWLTALDQRLRLETKTHELRVEAAQLVSGWRRAGLVAMAVLGATGAFLLVFLPIRFRRHANRELLKVRERIAGDLHDEVGSNLGSIQMFADLALGRAGRSDELKRIQRIAGETVSAVRDIVWLLRPEGEHRIGTVEHLRETSSIMLESLDWKFTANEAAWQVELPDDDTRHLFLFFRESLHNIIRHSRAAKVTVHVEMAGGKFRLAITDDGIGIDPERLARPATLHALRQRAAALGAEITVESQPDAGTQLVLAIPLTRQRLRHARTAGVKGNA